MKFRINILVVINANYLSISQKLKKTIFDDIVMLMSMICLCSVKFSIKNVLYCSFTLNVHFQLGFKMYLGITSGPILQ